MLPLEAPLNLWGLLVARQISSCSILCMLTMYLLILLLYCHLEILCQYFFFILSYIEKIIMRLKSHKSNLIIPRKQAENNVSFLKIQNLLGLIHFDQTIWVMFMHTASSKMNMSTESFHEILIFISNSIWSYFIPNSHK